MTEPICLVCGQPLEVHQVQLWGGVAHTIAPDGHWCSRDEGERLMYVGEINILRTVIRSLRWRAGRLRRDNARWDDENLLRYSDHWQQRIDRYMDTLERYYPRKVRPQ